jgi:calcineurin-like phosphoesterase family protein
MSVHVIADPHLGHRNISKYRKFISSTEDNTRLIQEDWNKHINKNDVVYVLGDAAFDYHSLALFGNLKGRKILVKGNHDDLVSSWRGESSSPIAGTDVAVVVTKHDGVDLDAVKACGYVFDCTGHLAGVDGI